MFTWECDAFSFASAHEGTSMTKHHHGTQTLNFEGFSGYYGSVSQGYGGFVWSDVDFMNSSYWQNDKTNWCDTGYQNALDGNGLAFTRFDGVGYYAAHQYKPSYGYFRTGNLSKTFSLVSMVAASAWETNQPFTFKSYTYNPHKGFLMKGTVTVYLNQTAQTLNFQKLDKGAFQDIAAVRIAPGYGQYGSTCSYGTGHPTYGNQLAFDDLKVKWTKGAPHGAPQAVARPLLGHLQHGGAPTAHLTANQHAAQALADNLGGAAHHNAGDYHGELMSLSGHDASGLTAQFYLPAAEHFGT
jgi:hypothetical protein